MSTDPEDRKRRGKQDCRFELERGRTIPTTKVKEAEDSAAPICVLEMLASGEPF